MAGIKSASRVEGRGALRMSGRFSSPPKPDGHRDHAQPAECPDHGGDFGVVLQHSHLRKHGEPIVLDEIRIAHRNQGKLLAPSVRHVGGDAQEVFKEEERAECYARGLAPKGKIHGQHQRNTELQKRSARHHQGVPEVAEEQMPAFMNGHEHIIDQQVPGLAGQRVEQEDSIKGQPANARGLGDGLPVFAKVKFPIHQHPHPWDRRCAAAAPYSAVPVKGSPRPT